MLRALGKNGGVLGVAYYAGMLDDGYCARFAELAEIGAKKREARKQYGEDKKQSVAPDPRHGTIRFS